MPGFGTVCGHMNHCAWISLADLYLARWPSVELQDSYQYVIVTGPKWESSYYTAVSHNDFCEKSESFYYTKLVYIV